ncbi:hypothetical protein M3Y99_00933300 [Aphelenchoides fujianensis]|nr:hypothetical protein M3Y99_00933300 [Aphelenchoides fujianensis]
MSKLRLMFVLFVCAIVPLAVQTAATVSPTNDNKTAMNETALIFSDTSTMAPVYREGFEAGRKEGFELGFRVCLEYVAEILAEKKRAAYQTMWRVVYFVGAAALFACVLLLCCSGKDEPVGEKTPLFGAQKKNAAYV